jgi:hypothetical protein
MYIPVSALILQTTVCVQCSVAKEELRLYTIRTSADAQHGKGGGYRRENGKDRQRYVALVAYSSHLTTATRAQPRVVEATKMVPSGGSSLRQQFGQSWLTRRA